MCSSITGKRKLLSQRHPLLYQLSVKLRRLQRRLIWNFGGKKYATSRHDTSLPFKVKAHHSLLLRKLGDSDMQLQYNKITNLRIALSKIDGVIIKPGETFSFCKLVGLPRSKDGYLEGIEISFGKARPGIGGGICQIANMIHWLVLHSPLQVTERSQHSFDPFPDEGRVLPFGSGAAVFYNYIDYQFYNPTRDNFQLKLWLTEKTLEGLLLCEHLQQNSYHVFEKNHRFVKSGDDFFRKNEIWRRVVDKKTGNTILEECVTRNHARVCYVPEHFEEQEQQS